MNTQLKVGQSVWINDGDDLVLATVLDVFRDQVKVGWQDVSGTHVRLVAVDEESIAIPYYGEAA